MFAVSYVTCLFQDSFANMKSESLPGNQINARAKQSLEALLEIKKCKETHGILEIHENVHIAPILLLVSRV